MSKYDIFANSMSSLVGLGAIFHSLWHMFPVRLILSEVLDSFDERQWRHAKMLPSGVKVWGSSLSKQPFFESESGSKSKITVMYNSINPGHG